jgi:hypothetical protein
MERKNSIGIFPTGYGKSVTLISPYIKLPKTSSVKRKQTKHVFAVYK